MTKAKARVRGRPRLPAASKRIETIGVRYTNDELEIVYCAARRAGVTVAAYVRNASIHIALTTKEPA